MSKFYNNELETIEFDDDEYVKIPSMFTYEMIEGIKRENPNITDEEAGFKLALIAIKEWNFKENGEIVPITEKNIKRLDMKVLSKILDTITEKINIKKKM